MDQIGFTTGDSGGTGLIEGLREREGRGGEVQSVVVEGSRQDGLDLGV